MSHYFANYINETNKVVKLDKVPEVTRGSARSKSEAKTPNQKLQTYELIKQCQQVSKFNDCRTFFNKTDKKLYILLRNEFEWYGEVTATNKQEKIDQTNTNQCSRKKRLFSCRTFLAIR